MFRNTFQSGFLSILYSLGSKPLQIWDAQGELPPCTALFWEPCAVHVLTLRMEEFECPCQMQDARMLTVACGVNHLPTNSMPSLECSICSTIAP